MKYALIFAVFASYAVAAPAQLVMTRAEYLDRVQAIWAAQMIGQLTGLRFEHKTASVLKNAPLVKGNGFAHPDKEVVYVASNYRKAMIEGGRGNQSIR